MKAFSNFVNGAAVEATDGERSELVNPATGQAYATAPLSSAADVDAAMRAAADGFEVWRDATPAERDFFRVMIENVTGVGPKVALSIMSRLSLPLLESAIRMGDVATLAKCPGIGKKTAERLMLELKGKLGADVGTAAAAASPSDHASDILNALLALGYSEKEALAAIKHVPAGTGVSEGIKLALKALSKA